MDKSKQDQITELEWLDIRIKDLLSKPIGHVDKLTAQVSNISRSIENLLDLNTQLERRVKELEIKNQVQTQDYDAKIYDLFKELRYQQKKVKKLRKKRNKTGERND